MAENYDISDKLTISDRTKRRRIQARVSKFVAECKTQSSQHETCDKTDCLRKSESSYDKCLGMFENDCKFDKITDSLSLMSSGIPVVDGDAKIDLSQCESDSAEYDESFEDNLNASIHLSSESDSDVGELNEEPHCTDQSKITSSQLASWACSHNISHSALSDLLYILRPSHPHLPKDPRTLLGTQTSYQIKSAAGGSYFHFGIVPSLQTTLSAVDHSEFEGIKNIEIQVSIDGLPLFHSSVSQLWPILGRVVNPFSSQPFVIGLFCGNQKPSDVDEYLEDFVKDMQNLERQSIHVDGFIHPLKVHLQCIICDTPARSFVKQVKGHNGYFGCDKCTQEGQWTGKVVFDEVNAPERTDADFNQRAQPMHHKGVSPFENLYVGMVSQFPLDYMHLVCLGVMRRLLWLWTRSPITKNIRVSAQSVAQISSKLIMFQGHIPVDFARKGRPLRELDRWKATEFRQFLLYSGPVLLKGILPGQMYKHFLLLFVAIYCLASPVYHLSHCDYANHLLRLFVTQVKHLYGRDSYVYNMHCLIHLAAEVQKYGPLDSFSAFPFENFLGKLKRLLRKPNCPLQQVIRRLSEKNYVACKPIEQNKKPILAKIHHLGPLPLGYALYNQFKQVHWGSFLISSNCSDNCVLIGHQPAVVKNIISHQNNISVVFERFLRITDFFTYPLKSSDLKIYEVQGLSGYLEVASLDDLKSKFVRLPYQDKYVLIPILHQSF